MSLSTFRMIGALAVTLLGVSFPPTLFADQQGWPFVPEFRSTGYSSPRYNYRVVPSFTTSAPQIVVPAPASTQIRVQVPSQAKIWFDNRPTVQTGSVREFVSAPLTPGHEYSYTVRATWREGDQEVEHQRVISFRAGDQLNIDFTASTVTVSR